MKLKKFAAALTAGALTLSLAAPALAVEAADARLAKVTLAVKAILDISDEYTEFYGEPDETALGTRWSLSWDSDDEQLRITATDEGKVVSLNRWEKGSLEPVYASQGDRGRKFPPMTMLQAKGYAQAFLDRVLADNEAVVLEENSSESLSATSYTFQGDVKLNGLASPMSVSVRVRLSDGEITRFWRGDVSDYAGDPGPAATSTTAEKAREQLKSTLSMRLEYVLDWDGKDGSEKKAVLRYLPNSTDEFYVDAATGELVNLTELRDKLRRDYEAGGGVSNKFMASAGDAAAPEAAPTLTPTELEGVAKLEGVLDKDALDQKIRAWGELGLKDYTLGTASYTVDRDDSSVTARVSYAKNTEEGIYRRNVAVDAKTGELKSMSGYGPGRYELQIIDSDKEEKPLKTISAKNAQAKASAFLTKLWGEQFAKTEAYNAPDAAEKAIGWSFTFAQKENGYFFPGNSISAQVDADGYIVSFSKRFDDEVVFDSADGLISLAAAVDAWCESYPVELAYLAVPIALDMNEKFELLRNAGYAYYNALKTGYALGAQDGWCSGVDAKTGEVVREKREEAEKMTYDDLTGHWAKDILDELARFNVGWLGGKAEPDKTLTQLDYLKLLASMDGYTVTERDGEDGWDWLYDYAYRQGLLTQAERAEDEAVTRAGMVKMLLNSLGYGDVARLPGIFRCDFTDAASIPEADLGYAALAQALGIVSGDGAGNYAPPRTSTRAEAAVLVWNYLKK